MSQLFWRHLHVNRKILVFPLGLNLSRLFCCCCFFFQPSSSNVLPVALQPSTHVNAHLLSGATKSGNGNMTFFFSFLSICSFARLRFGLFFFFEKIAEEKENEMKRQMELMDFIIFLSSPFFKFALCRSRMNRNTVTIVKKKELNLRCFQYFVVNSLDFIFFLSRKYTAQKDNFVAEFIGSLQSRNFNNNGSCSAGRICP